MNARLALPLLLAACHGGAPARDRSIAGTDSEADADTDTDTDTDADADSDADTDTTEAPVCPRPFEAVDTSAPDHVITRCGDDAELRAALAEGGVITFDCGTTTTIQVTASTELPHDVDTVLDGGGRITLDGGYATRLLTVDGQWFQQTPTTVTVQRITLQHFRVVGTDALPTIDPNPDNCSQGWVDGDGGALWLRDVHVRIVDATFFENFAADRGPDTAGGAVRLLGTSDAVIVGSTFEGNRASNGGAVGALFGGAVTFADNRFVGNEATGAGANGDDVGHTTSCPVLEDGQRQTGSGGNGGAISFDGADQAPVSFCGDVFEDNVAGALGGAFFRTENAAQAPFSADRVLWRANSSVDRDGLAGGPGVLYLHQQQAEITASAFVANQSATGCGAVQADGGDLRVVSSTFDGNVALDGVGGAVCDFQTTTLEYCTLSDNHADGGPGLFAGAVFGFGTTLTGCVLADNTGAGGGDQDTCNGSGMAGTQDLQWPDGVAPCTAGTTFADPLLDALGDHGGPTPTRVPAAAAAVIRVGTGCPATDQTGAPRPTPCTLGAVEAP